MAKATTIATMSPLQLATLYGVFYEDALIVAEMLNWAFSLRPIVHVSMCTGDDAWGGGSELQTLRILFPTTSAWAERLRFRIEVPVETINVVIGARVFLSATGQQCQARFTVGAAAVSTLNTFTDIATTAVSVTANVATATVAAGHNVVAGTVITTTGLTVNATAPTTVSSVTATTVVYPLTAADGVMFDGVGTITTNGSEQTNIVATSSSGTGTIEVVVEINHTVGASATNFLRGIRVEDERILAAAIANPADN